MLGTRNVHSFGSGFGGPSTPIDHRSGLTFGTDDSELSQGNWDVVIQKINIDDSEHWDVHSDFERVIWEENFSLLFQYLPFSSLPLVVSRFSFFPVSPSFPRRIVKLFLPLLCRREVRAGRGE